MRRLIVIPTIHFGQERHRPNAASTEFNETVDRYGEQAWKITASAVKNLQIDFKNTRFFSEGFTPSKNLAYRSVKLLVPGHQETIGNVMMKLPLMQKQLEGYFISKGVKRESTEKRRLYRKHGKILEKTQGSAEDATRLMQLEEERDDVIAKRINRRLRDGETGLLTIGYGHYLLNATEKLDDDIQVELIDPRIDPLIRELYREITGSEAPKGGRGKERS